jgi:FtsZ-interacting cell division protein ZipA
MMQETPFCCPEHAKCEPLIATTSSSFASSQQQIGWKCLAKSKSFFRRREEQPAWTSPNQYNAQQTVPTTPLISQSANVPYAVPIQHQQMQPTQNYRTSGVDQQQSQSQSTASTAGQQVQQVARHEDHPDDKSKSQSLHLCTVIDSELNC